MSIPTDNHPARPLALVTGASSGIGRELAREFAEHGFNLVIAAEDEGIASAATELEAHGSQVRVVRVDLATYDGVEQLYEEAVRIGAPLEAVAINAGVGVSGPFATNDLRAELRLIDLNVTSAVHLAKRVIPAMTARKSGKLLFTSSIAALMPGPFEAVYGASKAFLYSFAEALRNELKDTGVSVTALLPGPTETNFFRRAGMEDTKLGASKKDDPADVAREAYDALMAGKDHVVAGSLKTKAQAAATRPLPETVKAEFHRSMSEPGSAKR